MISLIHSSDGQVRIRGQPPDGALSKILTTHDNDPCGDFSTRASRRSIIVTEIRAENPTNKDLVEIEDSNGIDTGA